MKKISLFILSFVFALCMAYFIKKPALNLNAKIQNNEWKTFKKIDNKNLSSHKSTPEEISRARLVSNNRKVASQNMDLSDTNEQDEYLKNPFFKFRENRVLIGDLKNEHYEDDRNNLEMINVPKDNWKELLGNDLLRFQAEDTLLFIKEEFPLIKVTEGKGQYVEQVIVTFLMKNGSKNSFKAIVDSETGLVLETWDRDIHEKLNAKKLKFEIPTNKNNGIVAH